MAFVQKHKQQPLLSVRDTLLRTSSYRHASKPIQQSKAKLQLCNCQEIDGAVLNSDRWLGQHAPDVLQRANNGSFWW